MSTNTTIKELKDKGIRVTIHHLRLSIKDNPKDFTLYARENFGRGYGYHIAAKGGLTKVKLELPGGDVIETSARCSIKDGYNKKSGREIALQRAITLLNNGKELGTQLAKSGVELETA